IEDLLHAYADYVAQTQKPIPLRIAGDTPDKAYKDRLEQIVAQKGLSKQVTFLGMIDDVLSHMAHATALIVPSKAEGFGFITAEGMFSGALVIGRNTRGTKEQFDNGEQQTGEPIGLRYETQDELVELLTQVTQTGIAPYLTLIQRGQEVVKQLYSIESHQQAVYRFYQQIIQKPHKQ
ncbi:MAG: glycosyltransferase, partial [Paludibacteraceae bacterium]|nr:glycosyltransferase [Paludibacteraceae bacterium]